MFAIRRYESNFFTLLVESSFAQQIFVKTRVKSLLVTFAAISREWGLL
jgi:hypothetical protein